MPEAVQQRIEQGLAQMPDTAVAEFAGRGGYVCRRCGTPTLQWRKTDEGRALLPTEHYAEVRVDFDDGSANIMGVCEGCADDIDASELEWMYCLDLKRWNETGPVNWDRMGYRKPVSVEGQP